jgi:uncharacterized membrane protein YbaN (DUF454 family)
MDTLITNASTTLTAAVGYNWSDVIVFMKGLLLLIFGTGLGVFQSLLPYIIFLVVAGVVVYFAYRAFRFMRH